MPSSLKQNKHKMHQTVLHYDHTYAKEIKADILSEMKSNDL